MLPFASYSVNNIMFLENVSPFIFGNTTLKSEKYFPSFLRIVKINLQTNMTFSCYVLFLVRFCSLAVLNCAKFLPPGFTPLSSCLEWQWELKAVGHVQCSHLPRSSSGVLNRQWRKCKEQEWKIRKYLKYRDRAL